MHILVIEDDHRIASLIKRGLEEEQFVVTLAYDGVSGKKLALNNEYDLVITDLILPGLAGLEVCRELRMYKPGIPVIMLTALGTTDDKVEGFNAGADDYLVKPFEMRELFVRVRALINRYKMGSNPGPILRVADLEMDTSAKKVRRGNVDINLTPKEFKLLEYMMVNAGRVLSRAELAEKVWDTHYDTGTNFIDVYINYLRKKVDRDFNVKLILTKTGMGFMLKSSG